MNIDAEVAKKLTSLSTPMLFSNYRAENKCRTRLLLYFCAFYWPPSPFLCFRDAW